MRHFLSPMPPSGWGRTSLSLRLLTHLEKNLSKGESVSAFEPRQSPRFTCSPVFPSLVPALPRSGRTVEITEYWHSSQVSRNPVGPRRTSAFWLLLELVTNRVTFLKSECWKDFKCYKAGTLPRDGTSLWYVNLNWKEALAHLEGGRGHGQQRVWRRSPASGV